MIDERSWAIKHLKAILEIVDQQAKDEGLWLVAETAAEAYLQQELRRLHEAIEDKSQQECLNESLGG